MNKKNESIMLNVGDPCKEHWNRMSDNDLGKHCSVCNKDVMDFRHLTDTELFNILQHTTGKVCGRFYKSQLNRVLLINSDQKSNNPKYHKMLIALLSLSTTVSGVHAIQIPSQVNSNSVIGLFLNDNVPNENEPKDNPIKNVFKGKIQDENGEALPGVSVIIKNTNIGIITDINGNFEFTIPDSYLQNDPISFNVTYIGYNSIQVDIPLNEISDFKVISLEEDINMQLMGVVVTNSFYDPIYRK